MLVQPELARGLVKGVRLEKESKLVIGLKKLTVVGLRREDNPGKRYVQWLSMV